jgi:hypothetical protein
MAEATIITQKRGYVMSLSTNHVIETLNVEIIFVEFRTGCLKLALLQ